MASCRFSGAGLSRPGIRTELFAVHAVKVGIAVEAGVGAGFQQRLPLAVQFACKQQPLIIDVMVDSVACDFFENTAQVIFIDVKFSG